MFPPQPMYNYLPGNYQNRKSGVSILKIIFYFILLIIIIFLVLYGIDYYKKLKLINNNNNQLPVLDNNPAPVSINTKSNNEFEDIDYSEEICNSYTSRIILDDNTPEMGGIECLQNYILNFGTRISNENKYELKYFNTNVNRYLLDLDMKIIHFYDENGLLNQERYCLFRDPNNNGCIL